MAPTASTLYKQQSRYKGKLTREYASTGLGTIYWSSTQTLGITAGWFEVDAENTKGEELFITGITGTTAEYSGTVSIRGLRDYGADTNVPAKQYVHRVTSSIIVSDNHSWKRNFTNLALEFGKIICNDNTINFFFNFTINPHFQALHVHSLTRSLTVAR